MNVGHLRNLPFSTLLDRIVQQYENTCVDRTEPCRTCDLRYICGGSCRIQNFLHNGDLGIPLCDTERKHRIYRQIMET